MSPDKCFSIPCSELSPTKYWAIFYWRQVLYLTSIESSSILAVQSKVPCTETLLYWQENWRLSLFSLTSDSRCPRRYTIDNYWTAINQSDSSITIQEILTVLSMLRWSDSGIRESWVFWVFKHQNHHKRQTCTCARCPISSPTWFTSTSVGTLCVGTISVAVAVISVVTTLVDICLTNWVYQVGHKNGPKFHSYLASIDVMVKFWRHLTTFGVK